MRQLFVFIVISFLLAACISPESTVTATQAACHPSPIQKSENTFPEIQGTMQSEGEMWALLFFDIAHVNEDKKIVWRINGVGGEFTVQAQSEDGTIILPIWGPEYHVESSWHRPGDEWGTGFNFPKPGCWTLTVTYGETKGEIYIDVVP